MQTAAADLRTSIINRSPKTVERHRSPRRSERPQRAFRYSFLVNARSRLLAKEGMVPRGQLPSRSTANTSFGDEAIDPHTIDVSQ
jgi:hypothetical protein